MSAPIDIKGLSEAAVIAALHNGTRPLGFGKLHDLGRDMTLEEAQSVVDWADKGTGQLRFDYVQGRPLKVIIERGAGLLHRPDLYDMDCPTGDGSCANIIDRLRLLATGVP